MSKKNDKKEQKYKEKENEVTNELENPYYKEFAVNFEYLAPQYDGITGNNLEHDLTTLYPSLITSRFSGPYVRIFDLYDNPQDEEGQKIIAFSILYGYMANHILRLAYPFVFEDKEQFKKFFLSKKIKVFREIAIKRILSNCFEMLYTLGATLEARQLEPKYFYNGEYYFVYDKVKAMFDSLKEGAKLYAYDGAKCFQEQMQAEIDSYNELIIRYLKKVKIPVEYVSCLKELATQKGIEVYLCSTFKWWPDVITMLEIDKKTKKLFKKLDPFTVKYNPLPRHQTQGCLVDAFNKGYYEMIIDKL